MNESRSLLSTSRDTAIVDAEARRLARTLGSYGGVLTGQQLVELSGACHWRSGAFSLALGRALETGLIRDLGLGFYASALHTPASAAAQVVTPNPPVKRAG